MRAWIVLGALAACGEHDTTPDAGDGRVTVLEAPVTPNPDLDLLFMIDDSPGAPEFAINLLSNFASFITVLQALPGGLPNLHLGVITSDMGTTTSGSATPAPPIGQLGNGGCSGTGKDGVLQVGGAPVTGAFVSDIRLADGTRQTNYTGTLADAFSVMAKVGGGGCGFEQPLRAVKAALDGNPANAGFVRPNAVLGIVLFSEEDDCSVKDPMLFDPDPSVLGPLQSFRCTRFGVTCATGGATPDEMNQVGAKSGCGPNATSAIIDDVAPMRDFLVGLKGDAHEIFVAAIAGTPEPVAVELGAPGGGTPIPFLAASCTFFDPDTGFTHAANPGVRLEAFLDLFPDTRVLATACQNDLSGALGAIGQLAANATGSTCIRAVLPPEADCIVEDIVGAIVTPIPACGAPACWRIENDTSCMLGQKLVVDRVAAPDPATFTRLRCKL